MTQGEAYLIQFCAAVSGCRRKFSLRECCIGTTSVLAISVKMRDDFEKQGTEFFDYFNKRYLKFEGM